MKKHLKNAEHYSWGDNCDGWHLVKTESLSVIQETMPPNTKEKTHYHKVSQQFFYVLDGSLSIKFQGKSHMLEKGEGYHVEPGVKHQVENNSNMAVNFLVISEPSTQNDRIEESF